MTEIKTKEELELELREMFNNLWPYNDILRKYRGLDLITNKVKDMLDQDFDLSKYDLTIIDPKIHLIQSFIFDKSIKMDAQYLLYRKLHDFLESDAFEVTLVEHPMIWDCWRSLFLQSKSSVTRDQDDDGFVDYLDRNINKEKI